MNDDCRKVCDFVHMPFADIPLCAVCRYTIVCRLPIPIYIHCAICAVYQLCIVCPVVGIVPAGSTHIRMSTCESCIVFM